MTEDENEPEGLGGWLILPLLGLALKPVASIFSIVLEILPYFQPGVWDSFATKGGDQYHWLNGPFIIFQLAAYVAFSIAAVLLLILAFRRHPIFPNGIIVYYLGTIFVLLVTYFVRLQIPAMVIDSGKSISPEAIIKIVAIAILIPYFLKSRRVKNTFGGYVLVEVDDPPAEPVSE